ncbi:hypothetical protein [Streptomyces sp. NPDC047841]|uniref:hypothetical protein n=1 Tax=Streptomyces sp. NPDC047841 TaxID=3154708 RepID=UPI0034569155
MSFGEQVVAFARAAYHVHHGDDVDGRQATSTTGRTAAAAARARSANRSTTSPP